MADAEVMGSTSPPPSDHKRKLEELEPDAPEPPSTNGISQSDDAVDGDVSDGSDAKRPRLDQKSDGIVVKDNGNEVEKTDELKEEVTEISALTSNCEPEHTEQHSGEAQETVNEEAPIADDNSQSENPQKASEKIDSQEPMEEHQDPSSKASQLENVSSMGEQPAEGQLTSRKMEVPNNKVGVLIGKAGDTIRTLQNNSGARIQITRDSDADPKSDTRPVELIGSLESIIKAEKLIKDVIAEADAGGSPSLIAKGFGNVRSSGASEQVQIQVPNEKAGFIIGKGGETIKSLQTRSGARIQLIPQHLPEGDQSKERTVRITGDKRQIEMAKEMIKEAMNQTGRSSNASGGYNQQQGYRPRGPSGPQWGPRGSHPSQPIGYDYQQRGGSFQSQNPQYPSQGYDNYPPHQGPQRSNLGWEQRPPANLQGPPQQTSYDYYGGQGAHTGAPPSQVPNSMHGPGMGPTPSQAGYNYGQPAPYTQNAPPPQGPTQNPYGVQASQPSTYPQGATHPSYGHQDQYGKPPPSYNMPQQGGPYARPYSQPPPSQPGQVPYQGPIPSTQSYASNAPPQQQPYPYGPTGPVQQGYPPYGSAPANEGYPQQGAQPGAGYNTQTVVQQAPGYVQAGPTGAYGQYPTGQAGYTEQVAQNNAGYVYQGAADPNYAAGAGAPPAYGAPLTGQPGYAQPAPTQGGYDQSVAPQSGYPQQYDASQMYAGQR